MWCVSRPLTSSNRAGVGLAFKLPAAGLCTWLCPPLFAAVRLGRLSLHFREGTVTSITVNGEATTFQHLDVLKEPVVKVSDKPCALEAYCAMYKCVPPAGPR